MAHEKGKRLACSNFPVNLTAEEGGAHKRRTKYWKSYISASAHPFKPKIYGNGHLNIIPVLIAYTQPDLGCVIMKLPFHSVNNT